MPLAPYSPQLNPCENVFAGFKARVRGVRPRAARAACSPTLIPLLERGRGDRRWNTDVQLVLFRIQGLRKGGLFRVYRTRVFRGSQPSLSSWLQAALGAKTTAELKVQAEEVLRQMATESVLPVLGSFNMLMHHHTQAFRKNILFMWRKIFNSDASGHFLWVRSNYFVRDELWWKPGFFWGGLCLDLQARRFYRKNPSEFPRPLLSTRPGVPAQVRSWWGFVGRQHIQAGVWILAVHICATLCSVAHVHAPLWLLAFPLYMLRLYFGFDHCLLSARSYKTCQGDVSWDECCLSNWRANVLRSGAKILGCGANFLRLRHYGNQGVHMSHPSSIIARWRCFTRWRGRWRVGVHHHLNRCR